MNHAASSAHTGSQGGTAHSANHRTKEWIISIGGGRGRETATGNNGDADHRRARTRGRTEPTALATRLARAAGRHARVARQPSVRRRGAAARLRVHARDPVTVLVRSVRLVPRRRVEAVRRDPLVLVRNVRVHASRGVAGSSRASIGPWVVVMDRRGSSRIAMGRRGRGEGREVRVVAVRVAVAAWVSVSRVMVMVMVAVRVAGRERERAARSGGSRRKRDESRPLPRRRAKGAHHSNRQPQTARGASRGTRRAP